MRIGEIEALTWNDIIFDTQTICISKSVAYGAEGTFIKTPKTKSSYREVVIPIDEIRLLKKMKTNQKELILKLGSSWVGYTDRDEIDNNYVFCQWNGKNMAKGSANRVLQRIINNYNNMVIEKEQLPVISVHGLRHPYVKHTTKNIFLQKQKSQTINDNLIVRDFCFCVFSLCI
ncbi:MAG: tyrosine-type recombinase/integrase [Lachnospiraceae bacterium]|nr:tyrosine-type recombinase/integrase [Lachnospiraceae bacterium]